MTFFDCFKSAMILVFALGMVCCVRDVDFDQADDITLSPEVEMALFNINLTVPDFQLGGVPIPSTITDTIALEFLDDTAIQDDLVRVDLQFKQTNTFPASFHSEIRFLSEDDELQHSEELSVGAGSANDPAIQENPVIFGEDHIPIDNLKNARKIVIEVEVLEYEQPFSGTLDLASKGLFSFEFSR